jgi:hypothetical protein
MRSESDPLSTMFQLAGARFKRQPLIRRGRLNYRGPDPADLVFSDGFDMLQATPPGIKVRQANGK